MLADAAASGNLTTVRVLYLLGTNLNGSYTEESGEQAEPALCAAVENDHEDVVRFFVEHHADLGISYAEGINPLSLALRNYSMVKLLLSNGAKVTDVTYGQPLAKMEWNPPLDDKVLDLLKSYEHRGPNSP
jgi:hypothetical protein